LLTLDNGTSQWASASIIMGNPERLKSSPFKLQVSYDAIEHWNASRAEGRSWDLRFDETILNQAMAYLRWLSGKDLDFIPEQAEDYCFARAFGIIDAKEGLERWPSLAGHESNRPIEMEEALQQEKVTSKDHRVVQAVAMLKRDVEFKYPESVNKSWPQFWRFWKDAPELIY